jgi:two-component system, NtrC family, sensor kinase
MADELVLVVDDDHTTVKLCARLLERASYRVITSINPVDGLKMIQESHIDLLLSDIYMPELDGFELIQQAKQIQPYLPVIIMTGHGSIENAIRALDRGANGLIIKPFEQSSDLIQAVDRVIAESRQMKDASRLYALRPLFDVTEQLLAEKTPITLEKSILKNIQDLMAACMSGILYMTGKNTCLKSVHDPESNLFDPTFANVEKALIALCQEGAPVISRPDRLDVNTQENLAAMGLGPVIAAPIQRERSFLFYAVRAAGQPMYTEADLEMFVILARQAAVALDNARLYSELKDYVTRVEESQRALVQMEKMAAVGRLVASMAHEINNPLQAVRNCLNLASRTNVSNDQRFRYLKMMDIELDRLVITVKQMLDFYRPGGDEKELVNLCQILNQVLSLLKPQFREQKINVLVNDKGKSGMVLAVPGQIQQVLFNLLINAVEAIEETGCDGINGNRNIWIDIFRKDQSVHLLVEDSGQGIAEEVAGQLFEPFVSTKSNGTGLGLAVSYGIIERHQGSLTLVTPKNGAGACFEIQLPIDFTEGKHGKNFDC